MLVAGFWVVRLGCSGFLGSLLGFGCFGFYLVCGFLGVVC